MLAFLVSLFGAGFSGSQSLAQSASVQPSSADPVIARVGTEVIRASDLERRLAGVPPWQLRSLGKTPNEIRRNMLDRVLVRELLFAQGAAEQKLMERSEVEERIRGVQRSLILGQVRGLAAKNSPVTDEEVKAYYEQNHAKFHSPMRMALWRILVDKEADARTLIELLKKDLNPKAWNDLAREKSVDPATGMRGGNLGFVAPDGTTSDPSVHVSPEIVAAASKVKDGELVSEPVPEGKRFAIVWRRQSMKAVSRSLEEETLSIRQVLAHDKVDKGIKALVSSLRAAHLSNFNPMLVDQLEVNSSGDLQSARRPGTLPPSRRPSAGPPMPAHQHDGLR